MISFAGQSVLFRFLLGGCDFSPGSGWWIDDLALTVVEVCVTGTPPTATATSVATYTPTNPPGSTATPESTHTTVMASFTPTNLPTNTPTEVATLVPTATSGVASATVESTGTSVLPTVTPLACVAQFTDVLPGSAFYPFIRCLACLDIVSGYADGTFRPGNNIIRGQLAKIVSNAAGFLEPSTGQSFEDVPVGSSFHEFIERLYRRGHMSGYPCGQRPGKSCVPPTTGRISDPVSTLAGDKAPR